ncbi:MAG TPA: alpha/beta hydrolase, partial [Candidatus Limnocylindrales bacterium]|nr:alpha/beta hydrolase [Candidatus Limnocylindrales bacterium]
AGASLWSMAGGPREAAAILAVGGWTGSSELWDGPLAALSLRWRCVTYDHRGTGQTVSAPDAITHERLVDDVFAVLDAHEIDRAVIAAESAGAAIVLSAARRQPDRIAALVLVDPFIPTIPPPDDDPFVLALRADYPATAAAFVDACAPHPAHEAIREQGRRILAASSAEHAVALLRADVPVPPLDDDAITAPTLLIHCAGDRIAPLAGASRLADAIPGASMFVLPGDEHVPTMTRPDEIARLIDGWLSSLR